MTVGSFGDRGRRSICAVRRASILGMFAVASAYLINARLALAASHRGYVLEGGQIVHQDEAPSLLASPRVRAAYLGA